MSDVTLNDRRRRRRRSRRARRCSPPAAARASTRRRCAGATRSRPRTPAGCAWSSWRAAGRSSRPARAGSRPAWSCTPTPSGSATPGAGARVPRLLRRPVDSPPDVAGWLRDTRPSPTRYGAEAATVAQPAKVDNDLYVRDYGKCILCYKCVDACGEQWQNTFAIAVAGRGFDSRISTEFDAPLPESACVYCGNCVEVCPTGALMFRAEHDMRARRDVGRVPPDPDRHDLPLLRRRLHAHAARAGQHDREGHLTPRQPVTSGNLCIKGRFGFQHVQNRPD